MCAETFLRKAQACVQKYKKNSMKIFNCQNETIFLTDRLVNVKVTYK